MTWVEWSPAFAPHVRGRYREPNPEDSEPDQVPTWKIEASCGSCGTAWRGQCSTGSGVRAQIARFGSLHLHRDPFAAPDGAR